MKRITAYISYTAFISFGMTSCQKEPVANFDYIGNELTLHEIEFTNKSINAESYQWNFGDSSYSNEQNPKHFYSTAGEYYITLEVENKSGKKSSVVHKTINIEHSTEELIRHQWVNREAEIREYQGGVLVNTYYDPWLILIYNFYSADSVWLGINIPEPYIYFSYSLPTQHKLFLNDTIPNNILSISHDSLIFQSDTSYNYNTSPTTKKITIHRFHKN